MFLKCYTTNEYVADFQMIYDTDCIINVDFYADGLLLEPTILFEKNTHFQKMGYGLIKTDVKKHNSYEKLFDKKIEDPVFIENTSEKMILSILKLHKVCMNIERNLSNLNVSMLDHLYSSMCEVMAYRRFVEKAQGNIDLLSIGNANVKSYILKLNKQLYKLSKKEIDIDSFIWKYGFLYSFNIERTQFESKEEINKYLENNNVLNLKIANTKENNYDLLSKRFCWYEEFRHYYQMRVLRNYRLIFEKLNLNIYNTDNENLKNKLYKEGLA